MKRSIAILLLLAMILGVFAGCGKQGAEPTEAPTTATVPTEDNVPANAKENLAAAAEYLKTYYKDALTLTGRDFTRLGAVRVGLDEYPITWSTNVSEDVIKIVVNDDGTVTIDIADGIKEETPYVLTATLTDAYGNVHTVDFEYTIPASLGTMQEIVDLAYALENGAAMDQEVTLTGEIISVNTPYDAGYKNVTVTIKVAEREDFPIMCYRLKGEGADTITVGDTITVTGIIKNYNGTIEFDAGCVLEEVVKGNVTFDIPSDPKEIVDMAYALGVSESIPVKVTLTGKVTEFKETYTEQYKNISVWMAIEGRETKPILAYRLVSGEGGDVKDVAVGDTITVTGTIVNYNGTIEFNAKCTMDARVSGGGKPPAEPQSNFWSTVPVVGETYYLFMDINGVNYYFNGKMSGNYLGTSTNSGDAVEVTVEQSNGYGYRFYFMDKGVKKYIEIYEYTRDDGKNRGAVRIVEEPTVTFYWSGKAHTYTVYGGITNDLYFLGTYGTYTTFSVSSIYYITGNNAPKAGVTQYIADLMKPEDAPAPEQPPVAEDNYVTNPVAGTAYKMGLNQTAKGAIYYFTGAMSGYYGATETDINKAVDVYLEETTGGYYLYFIDGTGAKQYVYVEISGTHTNFKFGATGDVFTWDAEKATLATVEGEEVCYMGTSGSYVTFGGLKTSKLTDDTYFAHLYPSDGSTPEQPEEPEQPTEPTYATSIAAGTAYKLGLHSTDKNATYYFTGAMSGYYGATETAFDKGVNMYVEETTGGYYLYFVDGNGAKQYVNLVASGTYKNFTFAATASSVFTWDDDKDALCTDVGGEICYMGTYGTYVTMGVLQTSKLKDTDYIAHLYTVGGSTEPEQPTPNPDPTPDPSEGLKEGVAYVIKAENGTGTMWFSGTVTSGRFDGTYTESEAAYVYVENVTDGFLLYMLDGTTKTYIIIEDKSAGAALGTDAATATVFEWNAEKATAAVADDTNNRGFGCGATSTYANFSAYDLTGSYNWGQFVAVNGGSTEPEQPTPDPEPTPDPSEGLKEGVAYVIKAENGTGTMWFSGTVTSGRFDGTYTESEAASVYVENVTGGFLLYMLDGTTKTYIIIEDKSAGAALGTDAATATVFEWNAEKATAAVADDTNNRGFGCGATSTYANFSAYDLTGSYNWGQFVAVNGGSTEPEQPTPTPDPEPTPDPSEGLKEGVAYVIKAENGTGTMWFSGTVTSGRFDGTYTEAEAAYVYVENVTGGFLLYMLDGTTKTYIIIEDKSAGAVLGTDAATATVFEWNAEKATAAVADDSNNRAFGCGATSTYANFSAYDLSGSYNWGQYVAVDGGSTEPETPAEPVVVTYVIADYDIPTTAGAIEYKLDDVLTINVSQGVKNGDLLRVYASQILTFTATKDITNIVLKASNKGGTFYVETSTDGTTWTRSHSDLVWTSAESDVEIAFETPAKYIRLIPSAQMRIRSMTITFK